MKLVRYGPVGHEKPGMIDGNGVLRDLSKQVEDIAGAVISPKGLKRLADLDPDLLPVVNGIPQEEVRLGPCVGGTRKFVCIGLNYADHAAETGAEVPTEPVVFNKWITALSGPDDDVILPRGSETTDWEVELGVVIGSDGRYITEEDALSHVAGYCVVNDVSERSWQKDRGGTWDKGKGFDSFGPVGPWLVTPDEVGDVNTLRMWLDVDGVRQQDGSTATMVFNVAQIISYLSQFMTLERGDIISTGTPPGVGMGKTPPVYLQGGQVMTLGIEGLGSQRQRVLRYEDQADEE